MAKFEVKVVRINDVKDHPNADRLSLIKIGGYNVISAKMENGDHRYKVGDLVVYVPENSLVPEYLLKKGFWDEKKGIGFLAGPLGNRVKPVTLRGILSEGIIFPTIMLYNSAGNAAEVLGISKSTFTRWLELHEECAVVGDNDELMVVTEGTDVSEFLNIVKWEPEVPTNMAGDIVGHIGPVRYDIENIKKYNQVFVEGEMVYMTEKLHGCLEKKSQIMLANGETRTISEIIEDDQINEILSYDIENKKYITRKITRKLKRSNIDNKKWIKLFFENQKYLILTEDHPIYSRDRKKWISAKDITDNEDIESPLL